MTTRRFNTDRHIPQLIPHRLLRDSQIHHPAVLEEAKRRSEKLHLRLADRITAFAGSMNFVLIHAALFAVWIVLLEQVPVADTGPGGITRSDLPLDVRHDRPEPPSRLPTGPSRPGL
jgi:hypothetical protein